MSNLDLWNRVCTTDPRHTKKVSFGRQFTSIDPQYQIMRATEVFGPVGKGWGYETTFGFHDDFVYCDLVLWWRNGTLLGTGERHQFGPIRTMEPWRVVITDKKTGEIKGERKDDDAAKKAMTDALTKALSHLGFSADVFLGKYDDAKYVHKVSALIGDQQVKELCRQAALCTSVEELTALRDSVRSQVVELDRDAALRIKECFEAQLKVLTQT